MIIDSDFQEVTLEKIGRQSDVTRCLSVLLNALGWRGTHRDVLEALPVEHDRLDLTSVRNFMFHLGFASKEETWYLSDIRASQMPCLFVPENYQSLVLLRKNEEHLVAFDSLEGQIKNIEKSSLEGEKIRGTLITFYPLPQEEEEAVTTGSWFLKRLGHFRKFILLALCLTFFLNLLNLTTPLYIMGVYNKVIVSATFSTLLYLSLGMVLVFVFEYLIRRVRRRSLAYVAARFDYTMGNAVLKRLLKLPCMVSERASVNSHLARIKDVDHLRDFIGSPLATAFLDLPFTFVGLLAVYFIGGSLVVIPIIGLLVYCVLGILFIGPVRRAALATARAGVSRQELVLEATSKLHGIKEIGAEDIWLGRYTGASIEAVQIGYKSALLMASVLAVAHALTLLMGLLTIAYGLLLVIDGILSAGGLIASMIIVWRTLAPFQRAFVALSRVGQVRASAKQADLLMSQPLEKRKDWIDTTSIAHIHGALSFQHVSIRFGSESNPALVNVTFDVKPGEFVVVAGEGGAGKSTILKLIADLYQNQTGSILLDDYDIRQFDPVLLRQTIGYMPETIQFFEGTLGDNMRLAKPNAKDEELWSILEKLEAKAYVESLPDKLETLLNPRDLHLFTSGFLVELSLARALIKKPKVLLLDEPVNGLDRATEEKILKVIEQCKGKITIFMATHRPSHANMADKVLLLKKGMVKYFGTPEGLRKEKGGS